MSLLNILKAAFVCFTSVFGDLIFINLVDFEDFIIFFTQPIEPRGKTAFQLGPSRHVYDACIHRRCSVRKRMSYIKNLSIVASVWEDRMIQPPRWHRRIFYLTFDLQGNFLILTRVPYVNDSMTHAELEIISNLRVHAQDVNILNSFCARYCEDSWLLLDHHIDHRVYVVDYSTMRCVSNSGF